MKSQRDHWGAAAGGLRWLGVEGLSLRQRALEAETRMFAVSRRGQDASFTHAFLCLNKSRDARIFNGGHVHVFCKFLAISQRKLCAC